MVSNAALRYQPTNMSAEKIDEMVFEAGLANMSDEQRQAALEARAQAQEQARSQQNASQNANSGLSGLMGGQNIRMPGVGGGGRQRQTAGQGQGRESRQAIVMRNLWFIGDDGKLAVMRVRTGISSGSFTEIRTREEIEEKQVILREKI
jgi:hypothetical protein